jgi:2-amino-4-hydroxy-6-hydroxymethyldihydropteridine diphosphokinase
MPQLILSLGTNQGDRLKNLEDCIAFIKSEIGLVVKISRIYETPAWGFVGEAFYNCALVVISNDEPMVVLEKALQIEKKMGRLRTNQNIYESRTIDIDLIALETEIIHTQSLQIPHPEMQNRNFVLLPFHDLDPNWQHPILKKTIIDLIKTTADKSVCKPLLLHLKF